MLNDGIRRILQGARKIHPRQQGAVVKHGIGKPVRGNLGEFAEEAIRSVICQGYPNLEYIIVDGGSTDGTVDIIRKYSRNLAWWVSEPDNGMYDALNKGFARSSGEIMGWLSATDMLLVGSLFVVAYVL